MRTALCVVLSLFLTSAFAQNEGWEDLIRHPERTSEGRKRPSAVQAGTCTGVCQDNSKYCASSYLKGYCPGTPTNVQCCPASSPSTGCMDTEGNKCALPFKYLGQTYTTCPTVDNDGVPWCSHDSVFTWGWGNCDMKTCKTTTPEISSTPIVMLPIRSGETPGARIVRILNSYIGCSLSYRKDDLGKLVARGVDTPASVVGIKTNCGTTALGIMALAGVKHKLLNTPYKSQMAISWLRTIGWDLGALKTYKSGTYLPSGTLVRYNTKGKNDDHVEWMISDVDSSGYADHGGGGRKDNEITAGYGSVLTNYYRPLVEYWDATKLGIPTK